MRIQLRKKKLPKLTVPRWVFYLFHIGQYIFFFSIRKSSILFMVLCFSIKKTTPFFEMMDYMARITNWGVIFLIVIQFFTLFFESIPLSRFGENFSREQTKKNPGLMIKGIHHEDGIYGPKRLSERVFFLFKKKTFYFRFFLRSFFLSS